MREQPSDGVGPGEGGHSHRSETTAPPLSLTLAITCGDPAPLLELAGGWIEPRTTAVLVLIDPDRPDTALDLIREVQASGGSARSAENGILLTTDTIYVCPAGHSASWRDGHLDLAPCSDPGGSSSALRATLEAAANGLGPSAAAVVLAPPTIATAIGLYALHAAGGRLLGSEDAVSTWSGQPTDDPERPELTFDLVASPGRLGMSLTSSDDSDPWRSDEEREAVQTLFSAIQAQRGVNFRSYKQGTVRRRLLHVARGQEPNDLAAFCRRVARNPDAIDRVFGALLINVTQFFRDTTAFLELERLLPELVRRIESKKDFRIWVAGCSTGEEAYSVAMLVDELIDYQVNGPRVRIYATDIDDEALSVAIHGRYPRKISEQLSPQRLERHFTPGASGFEVSGELRRTITFTQHDLLTTPPFTSMDLVLCRNLLIYLRPEVQELALRRLGYALRAGGLLVLGPSEQLGTLQPEFEAASQIAPIHRKRDSESYRHRFPLVASPVAAGPGPSTRALNAMIRQRIDDALMAHAPVHGFLIRPDGELQHVFGDAGDHLRIRGARTFNLYHLLPDELRAPTEATVIRSRGTNATAHSAVVELRDSTGKPHRLRVTAEPLGNATSAAGFLIRLVSVHLLDDSEDPSIAGNSKRTEAELAAVRESNTILVDELRVRHGEMAEANEELTTTNEELQTANEELQSINEELCTINDEYERKIEQLNQITDDLENSIRSSQLGVVFVDNQNVLRRYTDAATRVYRLRPSDLGRSIAHMESRIELPPIEEVAARVLRTGRTEEFERLDESGRWLTIRMLPYRLDDGAIDGMLVIVVDVDETCRARHDSVLEHARYRSIVEAQPTLVCRFDEDLTLTFTNSSFTTATGLGPSTATATVLFLDALDTESKPRAEVALRALEANQQINERFQLRATDDHEATEPRVLEWTIGKCAAENGTLFFQASGTDVTDQANIEAEIQRVDALHRDLFLKMPGLALSVDADGQILCASQDWSNLLGYQSLTGTSVTLLFDRDLEELLAPQHDAPIRVRHRNGSELAATWSARPVRGPDGVLECLATYTRLTQNSDRSAP